jgi:hypothetical protein
MGFGARRSRASAWSAREELKTDAFALDRVGEQPGGEHDVPPHPSDQQARHLDDGGLGEIREPFGGQQARGDEEGENVEQRQRRGQRRDHGGLQFTGARWVG